MLLAYQGEDAIGCTGVRELDGETAELKRMFVRPEFRGHRIGRNLMMGAVEIARGLGYRRMRLDTLSTMLPALNLYRSFGFHEIEPYRFNPVAGAVYLELDLGRILMP